MGPRLELGETFQPLLPPPPPHTHTADAPAFLDCARPRAAPPPRCVSGPPRDACRGGALPSRPPPHCSPPRAGGHHLHLDDDTGPAAAEVICEWTERVEGQHPALWHPQRRRHSTSSPAATAATAASGGAAHTRPPSPPPPPVAAAPPLTAADRCRAWSPFHVVVAHTEPWSSVGAAVAGGAEGEPRPSATPRLIHAADHVLVVDRCAQPYEPLYERVGDARPDPPLSAPSPGPPGPHGADLCWVPLQPKLRGSAAELQARLAAVAPAGAGTGLPPSVPPRIGLWAPRVLLETLPTTETAPRVSAATSDEHARRPHPAGGAGTPSGSE